MDYYNTPYPNYMPSPYYGSTPRNIYQPSPLLRTNSASPNGNIIWVMDITEAKAYPVQRGSGVLMMDSNRPYCYVKTADQNGIAAFKIFKLTEENESSSADNTTAATQASAQIDVSQFVTKAELEQMLAPIIASTATTNTSKPITPKTNPPSLL